MPTLTPNVKNYIYLRDSLRWWIIDVYERAHLTEYRTSSEPLNTLCGLRLGAYASIVDRADHYASPLRCLSCIREEDKILQAVSDTC